MTHAPTTARSEPLAAAASADVTATDTLARGPILFLLGSALVWLVISGILALITSIQLHSPYFLAQHSFLTYGRAEALRQSAFVYGWLINAGLGTSIWVLARIGGYPLRASNWALAGAAFWNLAVTAGLIGIAVGDLTSFSFFQLPRYVQPLLVAAYAAIAISGVLAWSGRRRERTFAAQWYAVAALFLFPWLSSAAQLVLLWSPLRGVAQAVGAGWYVQGLWAWCLAPLALAGVYYVVPKITGRVLPSYEFAPMGFWVLVVAGGWTAGRELIGGPVPAWIITIATVATSVLLVHFAIIAMNLRDAFSGRSTALKFIRFGLVAYLVAGAVDVLTAFRSVAVETQFTFFDTAVEQLALYGGLTMMFFGTIYYLVPRLTGAPWASFGLTVGHRVLVSIAVAVLVVALAVAGWTQGADLLNPKTSFSDIFDHAKLTLLIISGAQVVLLGANLLLLVNFLQTISSAVVADVVALNPVRESSSVEARVS